MNRRSFFVSAAGSAVVTGAGLAAGGAAFGQSPSTPGTAAMRPSAALHAATLSSLADTYNVMRSGNGAASATASFRLTAAFLEDRRQTGQTALEEAYLLANPQQFVDYQQTPSERSSRERTLNGLGLHNVVLPSSETVTATQRLNALDRISRVGLAQYYVEELDALAESMPGVSLTKSGARSHAGVGRLKTVRLDRLSCQIIGGGAVIAAYTANAPGALILGLWYVVEC